VSGGPELQAELGCQYVASLQHVSYPHWIYDDCEKERLKPQKQRLGTAPGLPKDERRPTPIETPIGSDLRTTKPIRHGSRLPPTYLPRSNTLKLVWGDPRSPGAMRSQNA